MPETDATPRWDSRWPHLALIGLVGASLVIPGCRVWRDFEEAYPPPTDTASRDGGSDDTADGGDTDPDRDTANPDGRDGTDGMDAMDGSQGCPRADAGPVVLDLQGDSASRSGTICAGQTLWFELSPNIGEMLTITADYPTDRGLLALDLFAERPSGDESAPLEYPIWDPSGVRIRELVTRSGPLLARLTMPEAEGEADEIGYQLEVSTESHADRVRWLEPAEGDSGDGTPGSPWTSWSTATSALEPGDMLVVRPGMWTETGDCPSPFARCVTVDETPSIDCEQSAADGTADKPIVVAAEKERRAGVYGDGEHPAFTIDHCKHWELRGLRVRSTDKQVDARGDVFLVDNSRHVLVRRLLASDPNRWRNSSILRLRQSSRITVAQSEFYRFHGAAIAISTSTSSALRGLYAHSRNRDDLGQGHGDSSRGNQMINVWKGESITMTHSIAEDVHQAYKNNAPSTESGLSVSDDNHFLGIAARNARFGAFPTISSYDCNFSAEPDCVPSDVHIEHAVMVDVHFPFLLRGGRSNRVSRSSSFNAEGDAFQIESGKDGASGGTPPSTNLRIDHSLAVDSGGSGFEVSDDVDGWTVEHVVAHGTDRPFDMDPVPDSAHELDPELGNCRVYVPEDSPAATVDGEPIGAQLTHRWDGRTRTDDKLWDQRTGRFVCGAVVPDGINDVFDKSCKDVHRRFAVGVEGCPVP